MLVYNTMDWFVSLIVIDVAVAAHNLPLELFGILVPKLGSLTIQR